MGSHRLPLTQLCHLLAVPSARAGLLEQLFKMQVSIESSGQGTQIWVRLKSPWENQNVGLGDP